MRSRMLPCAALLAALLVHASAQTEAASSSHPPRVALIRQDNALVYQKPDQKSRILTSLVEQSQVEVLTVKGSWARVKIWDSVRGWLKKSLLFYGGPWKSISTYHAPEVHYHVRAHGARTISAKAVATSQVALLTGPGGHVLRTIAAGSTFRVTAWQQDAIGKIWYRIGNSWAVGDGVRFVMPDPGTATSHGQPLWSSVAGKGMWLTLGLFANGDADTLAKAAQRNGITHLFLESAISPLGFHGKKSVGHLIEAAHKCHITVIAWVYPYLYDLASDVNLTRQVAEFRTLSGQRFDGIAEDLEQNVHLWNVRAYSQLVRTYLGPHYLLVGVPYPPQSFADYPFSELARSYNVIAPMDYWHQTQSAYGLDYGHMRYGSHYASRYASDSVLAIRRVSGNVAVSPIGQTFDNFGRLEMGPNAPSAGEIRGFLAGSKASGAIGASFFQWTTATDAEWHAIRDFRY
jgi:SH3-like domain-containing protein